ncbi:8606_t:CDS:2 [Diversispora eburnea]|uniref:GDP-fucose protein O-fucosyltransferase 2 n=1 Tax=Diversispora eburnea TaxID=1213867 RepID=A0A9N8WCT0_9GLOM|nr:8606_t:CDS:2 [Diversispora eburnea]
MVTNEKVPVLQGITQKITIGLFIIFLFWNLFTYLIYDGEITNSPKLEDSVQIITSIDIITPTNVIKLTQVIQQESPSASLEAVVTSTNFITKTKIKTKFATKTLEISKSSIKVDPQLIEKMQETLIEDPDHYEKLDKLINQKYCYSIKCKFLFPFHPPEQETQCNKHFLSSIQLAEKINRTVVLTNVGNSRIWQTKLFPFNFYYDVDELRNRFPNVNFITQKDFQDWCRERYNKPKAYFAKILNVEPKFTVKYLSPFSGSLLAKLQRKDKFYEYDFIFNNKSLFRQFNIGTRRVWRKTREKNLMIKFFQKELNVEEEVMLITSGLQSPSFEKLIPISYAKHLVNSANKVIKNQLNDRFIGIHWRMERGKIELMSDCAHRLVNYIKNLTDSTGIDKIYFATDYPISRNSSQAQSDTFHQILPEHREAFRIVTEGINVETWLSTSALEYLRKYPEMSFAVEDELSKGGVQGIMDKLILVQSNFFISGPIGCCRYSSTFTQKIVEWRERLMIEDDKRIENLVDRW